MYKSSIKLKTRPVGVLVCTMLVFMLVMIGYIINVGVGTNINISEEDFATNEVDMALHDHRPSHTVFEKEKREKTVDDSGSLDLRPRPNVNPHINKTFRKNNVKRKELEDGPITASVDISTIKPLCITELRYLSLGLDSHLIRQRWITFNFTSQKLITMAKALSPAYLRLSGSDGDKLIFDKDAVDEEKDSQDQLNKSIERMKKAILSEPVKDVFPPTNFTMTSNDWYSINKFAKRVGWRIIFGFNEQLRKGTTWDSTNAQQILDHSINHGFHDNLDFELGNEPDIYNLQTGFVLINGTQLGKDVLLLNKLLKSTKYKAYYNRSMIVGPGTAKASNPEYVTEFLNVAGHVVKAVTWHNYYGGGELKHIENYTDPTLLDTYIKDVKSVASAIKRSAFPYLKSWQGETSSTWGPPGSDITMSYAACFMLLDKMGLNARLGVELFVRQTFYGFWFALVDQALQPTPGFWVSVLYKRLVGREVLEANAVIDSQYQMNINESRYVRFYAHCTSPSAKYPTGSVTLYGMNLFKVSLHLKLSKGSEVDQYVLTPGGWGGITARLIALNNRILFMPDDFNLPPLTPKPLLPESHIKLPSRTMGFFVIKNAKAEACM